MKSSSYWKNFAFNTFVFGMSLNLLSIVMFGHVPPVFSVDFWLITIAAGVLGYYITNKVDKHN